MYKPLQTSFRFNPTKATTTMSPAGINKRTAPQFLDSKYAINILNYEVEDDGRLVKRKGLNKIFEVAGNAPITLLKEFSSDTWIFGYGTTIARYTVSTNTVTTIKSNFSVNSGFDGCRYGEYFFVCNKVEKIWRIDLATFTPTEVAASPICGGLAAIGNRLFAYNLSTDSTAVQYSEVDDGSNPPFDDWTNTTVATAGGKVYYRNAGTVRSVVPLGDSVVAFSDKGFFSFSITNIDVAGVLTKYDAIVGYTEDFGGARGAVSTEKGVFYANERGLWQLVSVGQPNIPFSRQFAPVVELLGDNFFDDISADNGDIVFSQKKRTVYFTCARGSDTNNFVIGYNTDFKSLYTFNNWNISRFMVSGNDIYGASATKTAVYRCFDSFTDDGQIIGTEYVQELNLGNLETRQMLKGIYVQGFLSASSEIYVNFDIYNVNGEPVADKKRLLWTAQYDLNGMDGYNGARYSSSVYGGDQDYANLIESFDGYRPFIRNFQRVQIRITSMDNTAHALTWIILDARVKVAIRRRKMELLT
ncbi:hypothetical protein KBA63_00045 [Candidatus Woesebacteria bacterium]|nr:hypothetical protein [Candidatus Woesebacteria bacterium]